MKLVKITGIIIGILVLLALAAYGAIWWYFSPKIPTPHSDVPIEYKIDWWAYQESLNIESLETKVIFDKLNLFNGTAVVQYNISGSVSNNTGWRPYIKSVHLSERWNSIKKDSVKLANIKITPIVAVKEDEEYAGELIDFDLAIQDYLQSGGWGRNLYRVESHGHNSLIELHQRK